jgi:thiol-disulfide isomerase/thioredoxin
MTAPTPSATDHAAGEATAPTSRVPLRQRRWFRWATDIALVLLVYLAIRAYQQRDVARGPAPALRGVSAAGTPVDLAAYRGAPVMLHFWATWCGVCKLEQPSVVSLAEDVPVVTVASRSGSSADVQGFLRERPMGRAAVVLDPDGSLARRFGVHAYPTTFVLDPEGEIRNVEVGYTSELGLRLRMWLAGD